MVGQYRFPYAFQATKSLSRIIQLPYVIKSEARRQQAEQRRKDIEFQLKGSQYGIAYTDGTEKITQLNRPVENNLLPQIQELKTQLYGELGITPEVMNGTADEKVMLNYYARTIEPMLDAIVEAMLRTFLTKTARTQGQSIMYFRDPFKFVPIGGEGGIADIADKFTRNGDHLVQRDPTGHRHEALAGTQGRQADQLQHASG
jgi:hypothetical protein